MDEISLISVKNVSVDKVMQFRESFLKEGETSINGSRGLHNYKEYADWIELVIECEKPKNEFLGVQASTYFAINEDEEIVGCIELRHSLNENLAIIGGHIGYSVCPKERRRGYATKMLELVLHEARKLGIEKVLLTCDVDNIASIKTIIKNGGIMEKESPYIWDDEKYYKFWIGI
ncbi:MAG: GNAT family N-acetyltransferase [Lachnospiraceae bacterium]|nr:GNAT family N-acetyltransferase [Lachnospiraceae bacterium]